ncbi:MAG: spermidine/putrescine ABC transporter substrate-binding protein [Caldilineaceae bacterium]|jgi:spermidine/putrescine transport system substrate-binding protein|nr:spermidine/putrescine ABC transporter substrate-binding protein [Caldilineaceae bacterium]
MIFFVLLVIQGCTPASIDAPDGAPATLDPIVLYNWEDDMPQSVLAAFTQETGIEVVYRTYESTEEAVANLRAGAVYDVVVMENRHIPTLISANLLARLDHHNLPNFKNVSLNFRGLTYDPDNAYSVPYSWGTTGIVVRSDRLTEPVMRWADLWEARYAGHVALYRGQPRETIGLTLKSLGFSANTEDPAHLQAVLTRLLELPLPVHFAEDYDPFTVSTSMIDGPVSVGMGYTSDMLEGRAAGAPFDYVLPEEGGLLWGDNFVIPASSTQRRQAEQFIDFLLRPEIAAMITNQNYYAMANDAALRFMKPEIIQNPYIYPPQEQMNDVEIVLPLSETGEQMYEQVWNQFLEANTAAGSR